MHSRQILEDRRFTAALLIVATLVVVILVARVIFAQDPTASTLISDAASVACAAIATGFFLAVVLYSGDELSRGVWWWITVALVLWTLAEGIWGYYEVVLNEPVPYPSIADLFWIVGYIPLVLAILSQYRLYQITPTRNQRLVIAAIVLVFSLLGILVVLRPIVQGFDSERVLESLLNVAYPSLDLMLLILTTVIIFALEQGRFAVAWRLLGLGLVIMASADLLFSYSSWNEIYNPDGQLNGITLLTDALFNVSYLVLGLGAYAYRLTSELLPSVNINIDLQALTKTSILIFIDEHGNIISVSDNFLNLTGAEFKDQFVKMPLAMALHVDKSLIEALVEITLQQGSVSTQPMNMRDASNEAKEIWLTTLAVYDEANRFICIAVVLRANILAQAGPERPLTEEQKQLINYYLTKTGTYRSEENEVIKTYFLEQISLLYSLVQQFSGMAMGDRLLQHLNQAASRNNWAFTFSAEKIGIPQEYEGQTLARRLSSLLEEATKFAGGMLNDRLVQHEMRILDGNLSNDTLVYVDKHNLRRSAARM